MNNEQNRTLTCTGCKQELPVEKFHKRASASRGFSSKCKSCTRLEDKKRYVPNPKTLKGEALELDNQGLARCTKCLSIKPANIENFSQLDKKLNGFQSHCRECQRKVAREKQAARRADPIESKRIKNEKRRYAKTEKGREQKRKSSETYNHRRRQRHLETEYNWNTQLWADCKEWFNNKCCYCGIDGVKLLQDHFIPLSNKECPGTTPRNMVPACSPCNLSKGVLILTPVIRHERALRKIEEYFQSRLTDTNQESSPDQAAGIP